MYNHSANEFIADSNKFNLRDLGQYLLKQIQECLSSVEFTIGTPVIVREERGYSILYISLSISFILPWLWISLVSFELLLSLFFFFKERKYSYFQKLCFICVCHTKIYVKYGISSFSVSTVRVHANACISIYLNLQYRVQ